MLNPETLPLQPETRNSSLFSLFNQKQETRNKKPETRNKKPETLLSSLVV
jgi:hypothetical protein